MNGDHSAILTNFRLASFLQESEVNLGVPVQECDPWSSPRWLAPELLFPEEFGLDCKRCTKETDVYAFVMVMYEVSSLFIPSILRSDLVRTFDYVTNVTRHAVRRSQDRSRSKVFGMKR